MRSISQDRSRRTLSDEAAALPLLRLARRNSSLSNGRIGPTARPPLSGGRRAPLDSNESGRAIAPVRSLARGTLTSGSGKNAHYLAGRRSSTISYSGGLR